MYKLVVLLFVAVAAAEPGVLFSSPLTYSSVIAPATITKQASSVIHPVPVVYSAPWAYSHYIKKRSAPFFVTPTAYAARPLIASTYTAAPLISTPLVHSTPLIPSPLTYTTHFIKKRSLLTTYAVPASFSHQSRVDIHNNAPVLKVTSFPTTLHSYPYIY